MRFEYQERIDRYIQGKMTAEERMAFEEESKSNEELRDQLLYTQQIKNLITSREEKLNKLRMWQAEDEDEILTAACPAADPILTKPKRKVWYWVSGIAAVLVIGFIAIRPMYTSPDGQIRGDDDIFSPVDTSCVPDESPLSADGDSIVVDTIKINDEE